ncbi:nitrous oxide-stimulated promoter family protein [Psychromonas sp. RZ22]|nr:nitrous oxide-stimulated promoter family protein [Psychromonas sp. RZ22]
MLLTGNLAIELKTISAMTELYCQAHHGSKPSQQCEECAALVTHAHQKLDRCVYGEHKPACKECPIHCYKPERRKQAQVIMRYAGPKMLLKHPILAIRHLIKARNKFPDTIPDGISNYHLRKKLK